MMSTKTRTSKKSKSAARADGAARTDRLRKAALAEVNARLAEPETPSDEPATKPASRRRRASDAPKRVSALDAAATVLAGSEAPMRAKEMIAAMEANGLWTSPGGKTPEATLYAAIIREIAAKGDAARFRKHERGVFVATRHAGRDAA